MKKRIALLALAGVAVFSFSPLSHGAGFLIYEHGAAAMAMGGAFVGLANDASAIFHNPAGIAFLDGTQVSVGSTLIIPKSTLTLDNWPDPNFQTVEQVSQVFYPSTLYITHKLSDRIAAGFGFFSPYGLGAQWPEDYPLRFISTKDDLKTFFFNPTLAFKLNDNLSLGVGVSYIYADIHFELVQLVDLTGYGLGVYEAPATFDATGSAWGLNAGALYRGEKFSFGFNWRGGFSVDFEGDVDLDTSEIPIPIPNTGTASTAFNLPHVLGIGAAFNLTDKLLFTADVHYVLWSCYDEFTVEIDIAGFEDLVVDENWKDSFVFRGGLQYMVNANFSLRAGFLYDQTPQPVETMDPILPDADRWAITAGFGYQAGKLKIDVAYQFEKFLERTSPNRDIYLDYPVPGVNLGEGTYATTAHLIGLSIGFAF